MWEGRGASAVCKNVECVWGGMCVREGESELGNRAECACGESVAGEKVQMGELGGYVYVCARALACRGE